MGGVKVMEMTSKEATIPLFDIGSSTGTLTTSILLRGCRECRLEKAMVSAGTCPNGRNWTSVNPATHGSRACINVSVT